MPPFVDNSDIVVTFCPDADVTTAIYMTHVLGTYTTTHTSGFDWPHINAELRHHQENVFGMNVVNIMTYCKRSRYVGKRLNKDTYTYNLPIYSQPFERDNVF